MTTESEKHFRIAKIAEGDHPRDYPINAEVFDRYLRTFSEYITGDGDTSYYCWKHHLEIRFLWEELAQMTTAHNWAIEETHRLGAELLEARAALSK